MCGKLYCIGVGPGDPELMTIKALRALSEADVVAYPHSDKAGSEAVALGIATAACEELKNKEKLPVYVPGVPSFCAAAAKLGVSLAEGKEALSIIPASGAIPSLRENENAVFMKAGSRMKELKECDALKNREVMAKKKLKSRMHDKCP